MKSEIQPIVPAVGWTARLGFWLVAKSFELPLQVRILRLQCLNRLCVLRLQGGHFLQMAMLHIEGFSLKVQRFVAKGVKLLFDRPGLDAFSNGFDVEHKGLEVGVEAHGRALADDCAKVKPTKERSEA